MEESRRQATPLCRPFRSLSLQMNLLFILFLKVEFPFKRDILWVRVKYCETIR